jgi:AraC-like DNA-binding protein
MGMLAQVPEPVERDSRGILDPWLFRQRVQMNRYPAGAGLEGLVSWFWAVRWDVPPGALHRQELLPHPGANISVGHANASPGDRVPGLVEARLYGVTRRRSSRLLVGAGWTVAALLRPGGLGALAQGAASGYTEKVVPLGPALAVGEQDLAASIVAEPDEQQRVELLAAALCRAVDPDLVPPAREVGDVAELAEKNPDVRRLTDLCELAGLRPRTLQRMFTRFAGVSPAWVIRRYRLLDAAEAVRHGETVAWAELATALGYSDQAHLIRDFRAATGRTPAAYARAQAQHA